MKPFADIQDRLAALSELKYVDEDWGQLDGEGRSPAVKFPCVLIDCSNITASQAGEHVMLDTISVVVRVADLRLSNSSAQAPHGQKEKHYRLFEIIAKVISALHGWSGDPQAYGRLRRISMQRERRGDGVRLYELTFQCTMVNNTAKTRRHTINMTPL
ncbi:MAG: hypothetical protein LBH06_00870 [Rikenellaceae bacterium]|jgi:hypothetical protein|nr:hypothetical protein [Rikenellaceae bacterium]